MRGTRWKSKDAQAEAIANPMSELVSKLRDFLLQSIAYGMLSEHSVVLIALEPKSFHLFHRACFCQTKEDTELIVLSLYEAFYLCYSLKCLKIVDQDKSIMDVGDIWLYVISKEPRFTEFYKSYSHLRSRNWVVRPGLQYGGDFVVYRHHPSLVHSEYVVIVSSVDVNGRLKVWSDYYCTCRLCLGVAKTLLVLSISKNNQGSVSPSCLDLYGVEEQTVTRWIPEHSRAREYQSIVQKENY